MNVFDVFVVQPIFNLLMALYSIIPGGDFGLAVIIFTILIRILMWPLVKKQIEQVKAMRKVQPEMAKIKRKAMGNKQLEGMMMLELYKKHNVNPFRSIFILLIQLPIFIGLYSVIQIFTEKTERLAEFTYDFIEGIPAVANAISNPETISLNFLGVVDLTQQAIGPDGINFILLLLIIGSGILQYISGKQTLPQNNDGKGIRRIMAEAAEGKDPDQAEMNAAVMRKMIFIMPFMMVFIMINLPGILALYFTVSTIVAVVQQHILLKRSEDDKDSKDSATPAKKSSKKSPATAKSKTIEKEAVAAEVVSGAKPVSKAKTTVKSTKKTKREKTKAKKKISADNPNVIRVKAKPTRKKGAK